VVFIAICKLTVAHKKEQQKKMNEGKQKSHKIRARLRVKGIRNVTMSSLIIERGMQATLAYAHWYPHQH
jgi:hypothetical protein